MPYGLGQPSVRPTPDQGLPTVTPQDLAAIQRQMADMQMRYDQLIVKLAAQIDALSRPGAEALRPIGDWTWFLFTNTHTAAANETLTATKKISDQYEFWLVYLTGWAGTGALTNANLLITDARSGRSMSGDNTRVRADQLLGTINQPHELKPPRIFGQMITVETTTIAATLTTVNVLMFGIQVHVGRARGQTVP